MRVARNARICWFADLEGILERIEVLEELRDGIGLTTVVPESHISHTSGFTASDELARSGPLERWRDQPGLADHRGTFGLAEPAMAVLPGVVGGMDDTGLLRVIAECRRLDLEVWGHAGMWCYGAELFPQFQARTLFGDLLVPGALPWGTMFCPSKPELHTWIARSLADAAARYDLDGWFLDHARYPSPGHGPSLLACGCQDCAAAAKAHGVELDAVRGDLRAFLGDLRQVAPDALVELARGGPAGVLDWLERRPGVIAWFRVRARILADRFASIGEAIHAASPRPVEYGSDVFPPSVALLGGHVYSWWAETATFLTGGFGPTIGWGSVGRVTATSLAATLAGAVPGLHADDAGRVVRSLIGTVGGTDPADEQHAYEREVSKMAAAAGDTPAYPPIAGPPEPASLERMCAAIADAGLPGAMLAGLDRATHEQLRVIRTSLSQRVL